MVQLICPYPVAAGGAIGNVNLEGFPPRGGRSALGLGGWPGELSTMGISAFCPQRPSQEIQPLPGERKRKQGDNLCKAKQAVPAEGDEPLHAGGWLLLPQHVAGSGCLTAPGTGLMAAGWDVVCVCRCLDLHPLPATSRDSDLEPFGALPSLPSHQAPSFPSHHFSRLFLLSCFTPGG